MVSAKRFAFDNQRIDMNKWVIALDGDPLPGLYATGQTVSLKCGDYTGGTSVMRGAAFRHHATGAQ